LFSAKEPTCSDEKVYISAVPDEPPPSERTESLSSVMSAAELWSWNIPLSSGGDELVKLRWRGAPCDASRTWTAVTVAADAVVIPVAGVLIRAVVARTAVPANGPTR
jgi:hypothetical protein